MCAWQWTREPEISDALLSNPGIGFICAPGLMGDPAEVRDNRGQSVEKYRFAPDQRTWNHPDSGLSYAGGAWRDIEKEEGCFDWSGFDEKLARAGRLGCNAIVRIMPYSLTVDIPSWLRARYPEDPEYPFWRIDPNTTKYAELWARFVRAFAARYDGHPLISSVDMALCGAWGEGAGSEFVEEEKLEKIVLAYCDGFRRTPMQCLLHDPVSVGLIRRHRQDIGFRVDCLGDMGGFHGQKWSHMQDFYPENIENFGMHDAWERAPVVFEACWHMNDWYRAGWDIDYIIDESLKWHISSYNSKQTTVPEEWREPVARWVRKMGYRLELRRIRAGSLEGCVQAEMLWCNTGVAPCYQPYPVVMRLENGTDTHLFRLGEDIRTWLPGEDRLVHAMTGPLCPGIYRLSIGIETGVPELGMLNLAICGRGDDGFYPMGNVTVD